MKHTTTAKDYYEALQDVGAGTLFYLKRKGEEEYILEPLLIDTTNSDLCIKILHRAMEEPDFIAFPGTAEWQAFMEEVERVDNTNNK
jgi:hypothetical protein